MGYDNQNQLELFSQGKERKQSGSLSKSVLGYIWAYEKTIMFLIALVITGIVSYCFGVENGKRRIVLPANQPDETVISTKSVQNIRKNTPPGVLPEVTAPKVITVPAPVLNAKTTPARDVQTPGKDAPLYAKKDGVPAGLSAPKPSVDVSKSEGDGSRRYTIQVATFHAKNNAEKDIAALRQRGLAPILLSRGKFNVLCVGTFPNQETARSLLVELRKKYRDCYIRRL
jgi:cell division septation protein DedD